jgi:hypothetical protein
MAAGISANIRHHSAHTAAPQHLVGVCQKPDTGDGRGPTHTM